MPSFVEKPWIRLRDRFSSAVLGTTSPSAPAGLGGGLSRAMRLAITAGALAVATAIAFLAGPRFGALFFFPALMLAGIFGGWALSIAALAVSLFLARTCFPGTDIWFFAAAATIQTGAALVLRQLFRESRRWGVRYRRLLNGMSSAVTVSDGEGRIERPHPDLERTIGVSWPAYRGVRWLNAIHPEDQGKLPPRGAYKDVTMQRAEIRLRDPTSGDWRWFLMRAVPLAGERGEVAEWISILTDIHERRLAQEQRDIMIGEARHRLKNLITIIVSLAKSASPRESDPAVDAFLKKFLGRLYALSAASDLALASNYSTMDIGDVAAATLAPFLETDSARISFGGPKLALSEATGAALALGINELATNAIKYGALSVPRGKVSFTWKIVPGAEGEQVLIEWKESGGPPAAAPVKEGYGARVIKFIPARERNGKVEYGAAPDGYVCRIAFTLPDTPRVKTLEAD